jgi:hypothetical protein
MSIVRRFRFPPNGYDRRPASDRRMSALAVRADVCANGEILALFAEAVEKLGWQVSPGFA